MCYALPEPKRWWLGDYMVAHDKAVVEKLHPVTQQDFQHLNEALDGAWLDGPCPDCGEADCWGDCEEEAQ